MPLNCVCVGGGGGGGERERERSDSILFFLRSTCCLCLGTLMIMFAVCV